MGKPIPKAGRPHRTPGSKPTPRTPGATTGMGTMRDRAQAAKNGKQGIGAPKPTPQGGAGS